MHFQGPFPLNFRQNVVGQGCTSGQLASGTRSSAGSPTRLAAFSQANVALPLCLTPHGGRPASAGLGALSWNATFATKADAQAHGMARPRTRSSRPGLPEGSCLAASASSLIGGGVSLHRSAMLASGTSIGYQRSNSDLTRWGWLTCNFQLSSPDRWRLCAALDWATEFHPQVTPGRPSVGDPENRIQSAPVVAWRTTTQSTGRNDKRREEGHSSALRNLRTKAEFPRKHQLRITAHCVGGILIQRIVHAT